MQFSAPPRTAASRGSAPRRVSIRRILQVFAALLGAALIPGALWAQDVELLGEIYGTRPPDGYYEQLRRDPNSFRFEVEGFNRLQQIRGGGFQEIVGGGAGIFGGPARALGPRSQPVVGTYRTPLVLGLYSNGSPVGPFTASRIQQEYFAGPNSYFQTLTQLYSEMSGGLLGLQGTTFDWVQTGMTQAEVTFNDAGQPDGALFAHSTRGIGGFVERIVQQLDLQGVDWSQFDQDGDGFVDVLTVLHPTPGAECTGADKTRIWSHRWNLRDATNGRLDPGFQTSTPRPGGGFIYINDYTVQPVFACNATNINEIGVFAHELGHAFGLPDLYCTFIGCPQRGAGNWDLMGTGGWGCNGSDAARPCHMGAWTKAMLGWLTIEEVPLGFSGDFTLNPVHSSRRVLKIPARDGAPEYLLLENRQRIGSDANLLEPGLLIWHIDQTILASSWGPNVVNNDPTRMGVWLRQADGKNQLAGADGNRGDRGDPFPGCIKAGLQEYLDPTIPCGVNRTFHVGTEPAALTHLGDAFGASLSGIQLTGSNPYSVSFNLDRRGIGIPFAELLAPLVGEPDTMTPGLRIYLDSAGNNTGGYDLGDFRAFIQQNPDAPLTLSGAAP